MRVMKKQWRDDLDTWVSPILANMLWIVLSLPIVTMPLALVGLFATMFHWMDDRRTQVFSIFFRTIRRVWWKAYCLFLLDLLVGGFIAFNLLILSQMNLRNPITMLSLGGTLFTALIFLAANIPAWVFIAVWDVPLKQSLTVAIKLVFAQPIWTVALALVFSLIFVLSLALPAAVFITVSGALAAYIASWGSYYLLRKYISRNDFQFVDVI